MLKDKATSLRPTQGETLKMIRTRLGLYQSEAGAILGVGKEVVVASESGRISVTDETFKKWMDALAAYEARRVTSA